MLQCSQRLRELKKAESIMETLRWTSHDLELMPENDNRYEIIDIDFFLIARSF